MSNTTLVAIADLAFLFLDIFDRVKGNPEQMANIDKLREYYTKVKEGASDEELALMKVDIDRITNELVEERRKAVFDYVND